MIELLSENYPEALRQLDELSPILLKLTTEPKHQTVLKVLPRLLEKCIEDLSTERLKPIWVNLKECEDVILSNMHLCYLNRSKEPFRFDRHGRLRLTHLGFWHGLGHDHKTLSQLMGIAEQLEEYSERLLPFLCDPDLLEYYEQALAANSYDFSLRNFFFNHRESFKGLERLTETPNDTEQKDKFWNLHKEAASSLETVMNGRIRALAKEAEHSDVHPQHRGSVVSSFSGCNELLKGAFDSFTVDQRLPEDVRELFEIGVTDGLFRFIGATSEVQTEIETRLSNLYTLNRNIHYELKSPLNDEFEKNRVPSPRDLKTFFDYFGSDSPKKVTQDQVVAMLF